MEAKIYNLTGEETGKLNLPESIFGMSLNKDLVQQARVGLLANKRPSVAHTKDRSEVRGGGRKPWRQKGTGRARHGSRRSPIWKGGGVSHGPRNEKDYSKKINSAMVKVAMKNALSSKFKNGQVMIINDFDFNSSKTKDFKNTFKNVIENKHTCLFVLDQAPQNIIMASGNIPRVKVVGVRNINILDILKFGRIIFDEAAIKFLNK